MSMDSAAPETVAAAPEAVEVDVNAPGDANLDAVDAGVPGEKPEGKDALSPPHGDGAGEREV